MAELELIPIHTRILTHHDNIVDAILEYAGDKITDHDIVCSAESVVAITQNRYVRPEELNVCWQARLMNRFVPSAGSMASIYGMQAAMDEEGKWNMLFSFVLGAVAKLFGKNGILCVCLAQSPLYLMLMAAIALVLIAVRPVRGLRATFMPALAAAGFAVVLALPALLLGASATIAMLKIALKTFVNVSLVLGVSWTLTWSRMSAALKALRLPDEVIFTFDMALKHIEVLGRTAHDLSESVMLRSVGFAPAGFSRTDSLAGIMGMTFIKAMECSHAMDEAMLCRGFAGAYPVPARSSLSWRDAVYAGAVLLLSALCAAL